jgi:hypothetical protein
MSIVTTLTLYLCVGGSTATSSPDALRVLVCVPLRRIMAGVCIAALRSSMLSPSIPNPALQLSTLGGIAHGTSHCRQSTRQYLLARRSKEYTVMGRWTAAGVFRIGMVVRMGLFVLL